MDWHRIGDKPLSEPMLNRLLEEISELNSTGPFVARAAADMILTYPADTQRNDNVIITPERRRGVVLT